jgi:hypothetical protein
MKYFQNLDEDIKEKILNKIKLINFYYKDILNLRQVNVYFKDFVDKLFLNLDNTIENYCFNVIPKGCIVCREVKEKNKVIYTDNQILNPLDKYTPYVSFLNCCNNAECYFNIKKSQTSIAYKKHNARLYCNNVINNNNKETPIKLKRTNGDITIGVEIACPKVIRFEKKILIKWEGFERLTYIEELLELNPQLELSNKLVNPFDKYFIDFIK